MAVSIGSLKLRTSAGLLIIGAFLVFLGNNVLFENLGEDDGLPQFDSPGFFFVPPGGVIGPAGRGGVAGGPNVELAKHWTAPSEDLKNIPLEHRFATYISTDKPIYRGGDVLYFRGIMLNAFDNMPMNPLNNTIWIEPIVDLINPKGETEPGWPKKMSHSPDGIHSGAWHIPESQTGGEYTLKIRYNEHRGLPPAQRKFAIQSHLRVPRLKIALEFLDKGYGPGDTASLSVKVLRSEGGVPTKATLTTTARVDGSEIVKIENQRLDENGILVVTFQLPEQIEVGDGSLTVTVNDEGVVESKGKTIPILLQSVDITIFPEGGYLVHGVNNSVYFEALTPWNEPVDVDMSLRSISKDGKYVVLKHSIQSEHEGRGKFSFVPSADTLYELVVHKPKGITKVIRLPEVRTEGIVLSSSETDVFEYEDTIKLKVDLVHSWSDGSREKIVKIAIYKKEQELANRVLVFTENYEGHKITELALSQKHATGVLRVTAYEEKKGEFIPSSERLIFRRPLGLYKSGSLDISIKPDCISCAPGDNVTITIRTSSGETEIPALLGIVITDDSVLEMVDKRRQAARLPAMVYLEDEVDHLEDSHVYLDQNNPIADRALDLLLGTQGWRRFIYLDVKQFLQDYDDKAKRVVCYHQDPARYDFNWFGLEGARGNDFAFRKGIEHMAGPPVVFMDGAVPLAAMAMSDSVDEKIAGEPEMQNGDDNDNDNKNGIDVDDNNNYHDDVADADLLEEQKEKLVSSPETKMGGQTVVLREYAHRLSSQSRDRTDFTETVYWGSAVRTDDHGLATINFTLSHSITSLHVMVDALAVDEKNLAVKMAIADLLLQSKEPFYIESKIPGQITVGDKLVVPVSIVNELKQKEGSPGLKVKLDVDMDSEVITLNGQAKYDVNVAGEHRLRQLVQFRADKSGNASLILQASARSSEKSETEVDYRDKVIRNIQVAPSGFPVSVNFGGLLDNAQKKRVRTKVDASNAIEGTIATAIRLYPKPLANLLQALEALLREPYGCFEQTSSTTYPLVMAQQYFKTHSDVDPALISRAHEILEKGYQKLVGFETNSHGFEWFGESPGHEALSAYGLLQFVDMANVMPSLVQPEVLTRTKQWLLSKRAGQGFMRNKKSLDSFGSAPELITNAYIVWSLVQMGVVNEVTKQIEYLKKEAATMNDPYFLALVANILYAIKDKQGAQILAEKLAQFQTEEGTVRGSETSITLSRGDSLDIETTSLAVLCWLYDDTHFAPLTEKAIHWLLGRSKDGMFCSTQATVLALKAIVAYDLSRAAKLAPGTVSLSIDGKLIETVEYSSKSSSAISFSDVSGHLADKKEHVLELLLESKGEAKMPYSVQISYNVEKPASDDGCAIQLETQLSKDTLQEGEPAEITVSVKNRDNQTQGMVVAIIGLPAGLELRRDKLKQLTEMKTVAFYEERDGGRELVLYWRGMAPSQSIQLRLDAIAALPGLYRGPASRAYLYYQNEHKSWVSPLTVDISPVQSS